ncbi:hypothetical protein BGX29_003954, partial [Mortierella sp. GBA35]
MTKKAHNPPSPPQSAQPQSTPSLRSVTSESSTADSEFSSIERAAKRAIEPPRSVHDRSISLGVAAVFVEQRNMSSESDNKSVSSLHIRKRTKLLDLEPNVNAPTTKAESKIKSQAIQPVANVGPQVVQPESNVNAPAAKSETNVDPQVAQSEPKATHYNPDSEPKVQSHQGSIHEIKVGQTNVELEYAVSNTKVNSPVPDTRVPPSTEETKAHLNIFPQGQVRAVNTVTLPKVGSRIDTTPQLALCCSLLPSSDGSHGVLQQQGLNGTQSEWVKHIEQNPIEQEQIRWLGIHQQNTAHSYHLTLAVSRVLDVMAEHKVQGLDCVLEHEPLSAVLSGLKDNLDPYLMYQAAYAFQALQYIPDDETALQAVIRHSTGVAESLVKISGVIQLDFGGFLDGLKSMQKALEETARIAKDGYEGVCSLLSSGRGVFDSLKEGLGSDQKRLWYPAVRAASFFVRAGQLSDLNRLIYEASCRQDPLFQWGICQLLGEIATDPVWEDRTRQQAIELLGDLYKNDADWGKDESVKAWMATIVAQLGGMSEDPVRVSAHALLQDLKLDQGAAVQHPYPLRMRLPVPVLSPLFAKVQEIPAIEYDLHQLRLQRLPEGRQPIYIAPHAKASLNAKDDDLFPLMENVKEFLESPRQVMLILGDSGSGKSTFNRHLEHDLWSHYKKDGPIPLLINLPAIRGSDDDVVGKQLRVHNFKEVQIQELKQQREFILICDGYDESQQSVNLHLTNKLNQPGQWNTKMVISCRTQYLGPSYHERFKPQHNDRYNSGSLDLFQEAVIAPFSKDQIKSYVDQHVQDPTTRDIFGDRPVWSVKEYMDKLRAIPNLMDLIKNPFLLSLSLKALPDTIGFSQDLSKVRITRLSLYDTFVQQWLNINMRRLQASNLTSEERAAFNFLVEDDFIMSGIDYLKRLSALIFMNQDGNPVVQYSHRRDQGTWKAAFFGPKAEVKLLRESGPLTRTGNLYRFVHRSVLEYFYSRFVFEPEPTEDEFDPHAVIGSTDPLSFAAGLPLSKMNLVVEPSIVQFLAERVHQFPAFKGQLLSVIELSKVDPAASQAASNAITILIQAGVQFNGCNLRGIRIPGAELSGGQFDSAQLQGADLTKVNLTKSWIRQADFTGAQMEEARFGELPFLRASSETRCCEYSTDGTIFAGGQEDGIIQLYDTETWEKLRTLHGHDACVESLAYSPTRDQIVSGCARGTIRLWDTLSGQLLRTVEIHSERIRSVAFSPDGERFASASFNEAY